MKKKLVSMLLCLVMVVSMAAIPAQAAYTPKYTEEAETLYELGLFRGTGINADGTPIFSLQNKATRLQALIILIRLLGLEAEALATTEPNPFSDIPNSGTGAKYAAYAYSVGLTNGIGGGKFGNGDVTPAQFTTFVLRALGYDDKAGDFKVATAIAKGREIGLLSDDMLTSGGNTLLRDECVKINYNALKTAMKGSDKLLAEKLIDDGVLTEKAVNNSGVLSSIVEVYYDKTAKAVEYAAIKEVFPDAAFIGSGSTSTDNAVAKYQQIDVSPMAVLLRTPDARRYCAGIMTSIPSYPIPKGTMEIFGRQDQIGWYTVLDKNLSLIGYCIVPPGKSNDGVLEFVSCYVNGMDEMNQLKKDVANEYKNAVKIDKSAFSQEDVVTVNGNNKMTKSYLRVDESKLPASAKDFQYFGIKKYNYDTDAQSIPYAIYFLKHDILSGSADYSPIVPYGEAYKGLGEDSVIMLLDANKNVVGYTTMAPEEMVVTTTTVE